MPLLFIYLISSGFLCIEKLIFYNIKTLEYTMLRHSRLRLVRR